MRQPEPLHPRAAFVALLAALALAGCDLSNPWDTGPPEHLEKQVGSWTLERFTRTDYRDGAVVRELVVEDGGTFDMRLGSRDWEGEHEVVNHFNEFVYDLADAVEPAFLLYLTTNSYVDPRRGSIYWQTDDDDRERLYVWNQNTLDHNRYVILTVEHGGGGAQTWHFIRTGYADGHAVRTEEAYHVRRR